MAIRVLTSIEIGDADLTGFTSNSGGIDILNQMERAPRVLRRLGQKGQLTLSVKSGTPASNNDETLFKRRKVVKMIYDNGDEEYWRIEGATRNPDGTVPTKVTAEPLWYDLASNRIRTNLSDGRVLFNIPFYSLSVTQMLNTVFTTAYNLPSYINLASVDGSVGSYVLSFQANNASFLDLLNSICNEAEGEWYSEWNTGTNELDIHVVASGAVGGGVGQASSRVIGMGGGYGNRQRLQKQTQTSAYFSRVIPVGGTDEDAFSIQDARWIVESSSYNGSTTDLQLHRNCILKNGYPNASHFGESGSYFSIVTTLTPNVVRVSGNATGLTGGFFARNSGGDKQIYIEDETAVNNVGVVEQAYRRTDVTPYDNLIEDGLITPDMSEWVGGLPKGTQLLAGATAVEVNGANNVKYGDRAVKITGGLGDGIQTIDFPITPTDKAPFFSFWVAGKVITGGYKIELVDNLGIIHPQTDVAQSTRTTTTGIQVEGIDPASGNCKLRVVLTQAGSEVILDAWTVVQSAYAYPYTNTMGPRDLFIESSKFLKNTAVFQERIYNIQFIDPSIDNPSNLEVEIGSHITLKDEYASGTHNLDFVGRVVEISYEETSQGAIQKKARIAKRGTTLYDFFANEFLTREGAQNKPSIENRSVTQLSGIISVNDFLKIVAQSQGIGELTASVNSASATSLEVDLWVPVREGQNFHLAIEGTDQPTIFTVDRETGYTDTDLQMFQAGVQTLPIQAQPVTAEAGTLILMSGSQLQSYLFMDPSRIQLGVEQNYTGNAIGRISADLSGTVTSIPVDEVSETINLLNTQKLLIKNQKGENEIVTVNGDQTLSAPSGNIAIQSATLAYQYDAEFGWVEEPSYKLSSRITVQAGRIDLNVSNISSNASAVSSLTLTVNGNSSAIAVLQTDVSTNEGNITTNASSITTLESRVTTNENDIIVNASNISTANTSINNIETDTRAVQRQGTAPTTRASGDPLVVGDIWIDTANENRAKLWNGSAWEVYNGEIDFLLTDNRTVFRQASAPTIRGSGQPLVTGDIWIDTSDNDRANVWNGSAWVVYNGDIDDLITSVNANSSAISSLQSQTAVYDADLKNAQRQATAPTTRPSGDPLEIGDTWIDSDDADRIYIYNGSAWTKGDKLIDTNASAILSANSNIGDLQSDTNHVFRQNGSPSVRPSGNALEVGDVWVETDQGNRTHTWDGASWVENDTQIDTNASATVSLDSRVTVNEGDISANASAIISAESDITNLKTDSNHVFRQDGQPSVRPSGDPLVAGDVWVETDDNDKQHIWTGSTWAVADATASLSLDTRVTTNANGITGNDQDIVDINATAVLKVDASGRIASVALSANHNGSTITIRADQIEFDLNMEIDGSDVVIGKGLAGEKLNDNQVLIGKNDSSRPFVHVRADNSNYIELVGRPSGDSDPILNCVSNGNAMLTVSKSGVSAYNLNNGSEVGGSNVQITDDGLEILEDVVSGIKWVSSFGGGAISNIYLTSTGLFRIKAGTGNELWLESGGADIELRTGSTSDYIVIPDIPTSNPAGSGRVWNDGGTLKIT